VRTLFISLCAAQNGLQHQAEKHAGSAADERIPEIGNGQIEVENKHKRLRRQRRPENRRAANAPDEKRHDKQAEHHAVKNGAKNVHGLNQVFRQMRVKGKADGYQSPKRGEPFRCGHALGVGRVAFDEMAVEVNGGGLEPSALSSADFEDSAAATKTPPRAGR